MKIFYSRHFIKNPHTTRAQHKARAIWFNTSLHIYWYLQHAAVNDTKTHDHQHLSSRTASETFAALPLLPTHSDILMARLVLPLIAATTRVLNTVLHMDMSPQETRASSAFGSTPLVGCTHTQGPVASGGKQQHPWGGSVQTCALQDLALLPRSPCESCFIPRAASLTCAPALPFQLQRGGCTEPRLQKCCLLSSVFAFKCLYISSLFSR